MTVRDASSLFFIAYPSFRKAGTSSSLITAFGQTATTFISQNYAGVKLLRCRNIIGICMASSFVICLMMTLPLVLFRTSAAGIFSNDPQAIEAAALRMVIILSFEPICGIYECLAGAIRGFGHSLLPALITIVGTCLFRIGWIVFIFGQFHSERSLYIAFPLSWVVTSALMSVAFGWLYRHIATKRTL